MSKHYLQKYVLNGLTEFPVVFQQKNFSLIRWISLCVYEIFACAVNQIIVIPLTGCIENYSETYVYNDGHKVLQLYNVSAQVWFATSKTELDIS